MIFKSKTYGVLVGDRDYPEQQFWYKIKHGNCVCHREDLPAWITDDCYQSWCLEDKCYAYCMPYSDEKKFKV